MMKVFVCLLMLFVFACSSTEFSADMSEHSGSGLDAVGMDAQGARGRIITSGADLPDGWRNNALPNSTVAEFVANPTEDRVKTLQWGYNRQSERITLATRRERIGAERIVQLDKTSRSTEVRQTHSSQTSVTQTFDATKPGILDILMVVDNSSDKSGTVLGVDLKQKNINHNKLANKLAGLLSGSGALSGLDWKLVLATSESYKKNTTSLIRGGYLPGQVEEFKEKIRSFANDTKNYKAWDTKREKVVWKARQVMGDIDQPSSEAWKGSDWEDDTSGQKVQNFFPYSVWRSDKWVKSSSHTSKHSWLREGSSLAVILISDEDLQCNRSPSSYYGLSPDTRIAGKYPWDSFYCGMKDHVVREMDWHRPDRDGEDMWRIYGVFDTQTTCKDLNFNSPDTKYYKKHVWEHAYNNSTVELMNPCFDCNSLNIKCNILERRVFSGNHKPFAANILNNKKYFSEIFYLYEDGYALSKIAEDVRNILKHDFRLDHDEDKINSIEVRVDNRVISSSKYELDGYVLKLAEGVLTSASKTVKVQYEIDEEEASKWVEEVSLADRKLNSTSTITDVKVKIRRDSDGTVVDLQENSVWEYVQNSEKVKFKSKTVDGTLLISWNESPVKKTAFEIKNESVKITSIVDVIIGDRTLTTGFNFNNSSRMLTFDSVDDVPDYGETGLVRYKYDTGKRASYSFNAGENTEGIVRCRLSCGDDLIENRELDCTYNTASKRIVLNKATELDNINHFEVCYEVTDAKPASLPLPDNVLDDTIELSIDGAVVCSGEQLIVSNNAVSLSQANDCNAVENLQNSRNVEVAVNYTIVDTDEQFTLPEPAADLSLYTTEYWEVFVNDELTEDYTRDSRTITFDGLPSDSKVRVVIHLLP